MRLATAQVSTVEDALDLHLPHSKTRPEALTSSQPLKATLPPDKISSQQRSGSLALFSIKAPLQTQACSSRRCTSDSFTACLLERIPAGTQWHRHFVMIQNGFSFRRVIAVHDLNGRAPLELRSFGLLLARWNDDLVMSDITACGLFTVQLLQCYPSNDALPKRGISNH
jgi:hypothetical protein